MAEKIRVMYSEEEVSARIRELAEQINRDYQGKEVHLIGILRGGSFFMCELAKRITVPVTIDFMSASSYGMSTTSSGVVKIVKDLETDIADKHVLLVEDIIDSGVTLSKVKALLLQRNPKSIKICTILNKPSRRRVNVDVEYIGFDIPDEFVIGYGLDYAQKYRNLPYIGVVEL